MERQETLKWNLEGKMQDLSPFLKSTGKITDLLSWGRDYDLDESHGWVPLSFYIQDLPGIVGIQKGFAISCL